MHPVKDLQDYMLSAWKFKMIISRKWSEKILLVNKELVKQMELLE